MSTKRAAMVMIAAGLVLSAVAAPASGQDERPTVVVLSLTGVVDPFLASYVEGHIENAERDNASAVLLTIDTPGGLSSSMRQITEAILNAGVPVICYASPAGARAASAGTFIMLACPVNAMAPGTNIGAAHPVGVAGAIEQQKATNDAAAFIRSLAQQWERNADWAEDAVRRSVSVSAEEAVRLNVVDSIAPSVPTLLTQVNERFIRLSNGTSVVLRTANASLERRELGAGAALLHGLITPDLAFLFFWVGLVLIVIEILHPGLSIPGVLGVLMLVGAFLSFGLLPVQLAGVVLLLASAGFFLLELNSPGIGLPTLGGAITLVVGGLVLFDSSVPDASVSPWMLAVVTAALVGFFGFVVQAAIRVRRLPRPRGLEELVGERAVALSELNPQGEVLARHETWSAEAIGPPIPAGATVRIIEVSGLKLTVAPASPLLGERELTGSRSPQTGPSQSEGEA
ncbi:MAG: nodulation protein NfeD [Actinomycetota bacterium]|nr:nodulation protein NfeD [Actinomycetota bacterium]